MKVLIQNVATEQTAIEMMAKTCIASVQVKHTWTRVNCTSLNVAVFFLKQKPRTLAETHLSALDCIRVCVVDVFFCIL